MKVVLSEVFLVSGKLLHVLWPQHFNKTFLSLSVMFSTTTRAFTHIFTCKSLCEPFNSFFFFFYSFLQTPKPDQPCQVFRQVPFVLLCSVQPARERSPVTFSFSGTLCDASLLLAGSSRAQAVLSLSHSSRNSLPGRLLCDEREHQQITGDAQSHEEAANEKCIQTTV